MNTRIMVILTVVLAFVLPVCGQDATPLAEDEAWPPVAVGAIGNEEQLGGWFGLSGDYTTVGFDGRYVSKYGKTDESTEILSVFVAWKAVPKLTIPVSGLLPQWELPGPESIDVQLNLIGRLGYETEHKDVIATVGAEVELLTLEGASLALRYEYAFDDDLWNELSDAMGQHQTFLNLKVLLPD